MRRIQIILILLLTLLVGAGLKVWLLSQEVIPFNSDEAIVALMARHILAGERPVFFYGQSYMGSLDAFLVALGFLIFGSHVWVIRLVQTTLYLSTIIATVLAGRLAFNSWNVGLFSGFFLAIPTVNFTLYTTASLGGYGEALLLGSLLLLVYFWLSGLVLEKPGRFSFKILTAFGLWGILAGIGFWANGITLVFSIPSGLGMLAVLIRYWQLGRAKWIYILPIVAISGFFIGSMPWWLSILQNGLDLLVNELFGGAVAVERGTFFSRTLDHLINLILLGGTVTFGLRPPWEVRWLALPLLPPTLIFWFAVIFFWFRELFRSSDYQKNLWVLMGVPLLVVSGFLFTSFGVDPSGRYFVPLAIPLALTAAQFLWIEIARRWARFAALAIVLAFNLAGTVECAFRYPPGLTTQFYSATIIDHRYDQELIRFLEANAERRGYTNYWVAYPLAFLSGEQLIFIPALPYHLDLRYTDRDNRYSPYNDAVKNSQRIAYITTRNPALDDYLRAKFVENAIKWQEEVIGDYRVYYRLSKAIRPEDIGLGN
ncbi:MAG: hypothetical protein HPY59_10970 [Anaerolineae bacterium]|nr:hypothetical protein [Anaerolineae bacterium]